MRITDVETIIVRQPDGITLIGDGTQDTVIVLVHTDAGITGAAEVDSAPYVVKAVIDMRTPPVRGCGSWWSARTPSTSKKSGIKCTPMPITTAAPPRSSMP